MEILRRTPWSRIREQNSVYKEFLEIVGHGKPTGSVKGDNCSFHHDMNKRWKKFTIKSVSEFFHAAEWAKTIEDPKSQRKKSQW